MPKREIKTTSEYLRQAALPEATDTYTVIPHGDIMDKTKEMLEQHNLVIHSEEYRCTQHANIAQGIYYLSFKDDPDIGLLFTWRNSYNKTVRFSCSIGGYVHNSMSTLVKPNVGSWIRKHTGTADQEVNDVIEEQMKKASQIFEDLKADKDMMKTVEIEESKIAGFIGNLYLVNDLLTTTQMAVIKRELEKPSFQYGGVDNSLWHYYNCILIALQQSHPITWLEQHTTLHFLVCDTFNIMPSILANMNDDVVVPEGEDVPIEDNVPSLIQEEVQEEIEQPEVTFSEGTDFPSTEDEPTVISEEEWSESLELTEEPNTTEDELKEEPIQPPVEEVEELSLEERRKLINEKIQENQEEEVLEVIQEEEIEEGEVDYSWPCLSCGEVQGANDVFYEGQLCEKCYNK